jgi:hypothetical protein
MGFGCVCGWYRVDGVWLGGVGGGGDHVGLATHTQDVRGMTTTWRTGQERGRGVREGSGLGAGVLFGVEGRKRGFCDVVLCCVLNVSGAGVELWCVDVYLRPRCGRCGWLVP